MSISNISLYIPHVFPNITEERIRRVFNTLYIGQVSHVDFVTKMDKYGKYYNAAYIHFEFWYQNYVAFRFQERVLDPKLEAKLVYDDPWYWVVLENKSVKHVVNGRKPRINLTDFAQTKVLVENPDQDYYYQEYYIPDYYNDFKNKNIFHDRAYVETLLVQFNRELDHLFDNGNYSLSRKEANRANILQEQIYHYEDWLKKPIPRINIDDELDQLLDEMDDTVLEYFLDRLNDGRPMDQHYSQQEEVYKIKEQNELEEQRRLEVYSMV